MSPQRTPKARTATAHAARGLIANRLREAREKAQLSQEALAKRLGRPKSFVTDIENGNRRLILEELWDIARVMNRPVSYFADPPRDDYEQDEWDFQVEEFERGDAKAPRPRRSPRNPREAFERGMRRGEGRP